jgi:hypothetical protein
MNRIAFVLLGGLAWAATGCVGSEVTYTAKSKYPSKPENCPIEVFPSTTPDRAWEDLATVEAHCHNWMGRSACIENLKQRACELGGDAIYDLKDGKRAEASIVIATVARNTGEGKRVAKQGGSPSHGEAEEEAEDDSKAKSEAKADSCDPPCSPGYKCSAGECIAVCNPACGEGMRCNQQRSCEPVSSSK